MMIIEANLANDDDDEFECKTDSDCGRNALCIYAQLYTGEFTNDPGMVKCDCDHGYLTDS